MRKYHQLYILLILSIFFIPAAYVYVAVGFVVQMCCRKYVTIKSIKSNKILAIIFIYIIIGVVFSDYLLISCFYGIMMMLCLYSMGMIAYNMEYLDVYSDRIKKLIYIVSIIVFVIGIMQYLNPEFVMPKKWVDGEEYQLKKRIFSTFFNPNVFGFYINLILIMVCGTIDFSKLDKLELIVFVMGIICLFLTFSRTAWLSLIVSLFISGILFNKKYFKFALIIALVIIGFDKILSIGRSDPSKVLEDSSILYRFEIWKACFNIAKDNLITGIGFGTLFKYITIYSNVVKSNIEHCHNLYIQILTETGVIGLSGFLYVLYNLIRKLWLKAREGNNQQWTTSFIIIIMVLIHSMVDSVFLTPQIMMVLSIYIGIMLNKSREQLMTVPYDDNVHY